MFGRKPKSTQYMQGLIYAEQLHESGITVDDLVELLREDFFIKYKRFNAGFRDFIHLLKLRALQND